MALSILSVKMNKYLIMQIGVWRILLLCGSIRLPLYKSHAFTALIKANGN
jgi:hypothetical protein